MKKRYYVCDVTAHLYIYPFVLHVYFSGMYFSWCMCAIIKKSHIPSRSGQVCVFIFVFVHVFVYGFVCVCPHKRSIYESSKNRFLKAHA